MVKVSVEVLATNVSAPDGMVTVPPFDIDDITGVVKVLFVRVCVAESSTKFPLTFGKIIDLSAVGFFAFNRISKSFAVDPSKTTASLSNVI